MVANSLGDVGLVLTASRDGGRLMGGISGRARLYRAGRAVSPMIAFGLGIVLLVLGHRHFAQFSFVLIPIQIAVCRRLLAPKPVRPPMVAAKRP
jgi:hypothetical protein